MKRIATVLSILFMSSVAWAQSQFPAHTTWGNPAASSALPKQMTQAEVAAMCNTFTSLLIGCVPASGGGTANFLRADGMWSPPSGGVAGSIAVGTTTVTGGTSNQLIFDNGGVVGEITKGNNCFYQTNASGVASCLLNVKTQLSSQTTFYVNGNAATTNAITAAGNNTLHFPAGSGTTNAITAAGNNILHFASTPVTIYVGAAINDTTTSVIPANTTVTAISQTTVTLSANVTGGGVGSGDTIQWSLNTFFVGQTITDVTSAVIPGGTTISSVSVSGGSTSVVMSANATGGGVGNGDTIAWTAVCGVAGASTCGIGSDSVTALQAQSPATPFLTLANAVKVAVNSYDFQSIPPIFNLAHGASTNYSGGCGLGGNNGAVSGSGAIWIFGDSSAPTAATMIAKNNGYALWVGHFCVVRTANLSVGDQGSAGTGFHVTEWGGIDFQTGVTTFGQFNTSAYQLLGDGYGHFELGDNNALTFVGGAAGWLNISSMARFDAGSTNGAFPVVQYTINIPTAVVYAVAGVNGAGPFSFHNFTASTFTGAGVAGTTGVRAIITGTGYLEGASTCSAVFPGNAACQLSNGFVDGGGDAVNFAKVLVSSTTTLSPDSPLEINLNTVNTLAPQAGTQIHLVGANGNANVGMLFDTFQNGTGAGNPVFFGRVANGTAAAPTAMPAAATGFSVGAQGYDGVSAYGTLANFQIESINQTSTTDHGGLIRFRTVASGAVGTPVSRLLLQQGVTIGSGSVDPGAGNLGFANLAFSGTAPTISSGFCSTSPSITANNGTVAFDINVGTSCSGSTGTLGMPTAATGWVCDFHNVTNPATNVVEQTGGATNTVTLTNYVRTTGVAGNFTASDHIRAKCVAY